MSKPIAPTNSAWLIASLQQACSYPHPVESISLIETHISWVFLTGNYVYKVKKPVDMGFLDFSTLAKRRHCCQREISLNRRLSPDYYLEVVALKQRDGLLVIEPDSYPESDTDKADPEVVDYAVKMKQFPQQAQLDRLLADARLEPKQIDLMAETIARFHQRIENSSPDSNYGSPELVLKNVVDCYNNALAHLTEQADQSRIATLKDWSCQQFEPLKEIFEQRKKAGFIRQCHGDLHLGNIALVDDEVVIFDGIEFNEDLLWNDLISEVAFLISDLDEHDKTELAFRFFNRYLELTGDYAGVATLKYYLTYRASVRAMVSSIRLTQPGLGKAQRQKERASFESYLSLAEGYSREQKNKLILMHGFSGSGKTCVSQHLLERLPAIRIRSDIERKRLMALQETERPDKARQAEVYSERASQQTYQRLLELAEVMLKANSHVIVDAAFLRPEQRAPFLQLAKQMDKDAIILSCNADEQLLYQWVKQRQYQNKDASDAGCDVLRQQIENQIDFTPEEKPFLLQLDTGEIDFRPDPQQESLELTRLCKLLLKGL